MQRPPRMYPVPKTAKISGSTLNQLMHSADGFQTSEWHDCPSRINPSRGLSPTLTAGHSS